MSANDAAAYLGTKRATLYRLAASGKLPFVRVASDMKFLRGDCDRYLAAQRVSVD